MKKLLCFLISLLFALTTFGQFSVGPRVGVNFSTETGKWNEHDDSKNKWITGPVAGAAGNYTFTEMFSLNAELLYITMGHKTVTTYEDGSRSLNEMTCSVRKRLNCIQLAFLARSSFIGGFVSPFVFIGPYFTRFGGGKVKVDDGITTKIYDVVWDAWPSRGDTDKWYIDPKYNRRFDFGMYIGGGVGKELGPGRLELDLRFGMGLIDLWKFDSKEDKQNAKDNGYKAYRSMNISLTLAYMYIFKEK